MEHILCDCLGVKYVIVQDEFKNIMGETDTIALMEETWNAKVLIGLFELFTINLGLSIFIFFGLIDFANLWFFLLIYLETVLTSFLH